MSIDFSAIGPAGVGPPVLARLAEETAALERRLCHEHRAAAAAGVALPEADNHQPGEGKAESNQAWPEQTPPTEKVLNRKDELSPPPEDRLLDLTA